ncbi:MAG: paraquat-inducible protein A [Candidatus Competibacter sp.]|nr:paraquat-inducible protein A [Candidatus Competibacter sp.]MDG4584257.1 paraquat-inducible protein A [Candidatus Competibacter sp.]
MNANSPAFPPAAADALVACHDCDLLYRKRPLREGEKARCGRCGALLYARKSNSIERALTLALAALILFGLANAFPLLDFQFQGRGQQSSVLSGVWELYAQGMWALAAVVFVASILAPLLKILALLYVLLPLRVGRRPWRMAWVFRWIETLHPWAMTEVYLLGVLVAFVKLSDIATIVPGVALYSFAALIVAMAATDAALEPEAIWERLETRR